MAPPVSLFRPAATEVRVAGEAVTAIYPPFVGGIITNPVTAQGQGIAVVEELYIDLVGPATLGPSKTTTALQPGQSYVLIANQGSNVSVNAATAGHRFSGLVYQPPIPFPPTPEPSDFPPGGPTSLTETIPSYLYVQYADDEDLQAFVAAFNAMAQRYVDWFNSVALPVYPGLSGPLLDWVAQGLYGMVRPAFGSGLNRGKGPLNTYAYNELGYNQRKRIGPKNVVSTNDDIFKRVMTWNFYKGDGAVVNARWLKRRIMRFLTQPDGAAGAVDQTYQISVTFGAGGLVSIRLAGGSRRVLGGAFYNSMGFNSRAYNSLSSVFVPGPNPLPNQAVLKEAILSGVLQLPFQYQFSVSV